VPQLTGAFLSRLARPANARRAFSWLRSALIRPLGNGHNKTPWGCRGAGCQPGCTAAPRFLLLRWFQVWPRSGKEDRGH
jgi:hypothetical protein